MRCMVVHVCVISQIEITEAIPEVLPGSNAMATCSLFVLASVSVPAFDGFQIPLPQANSLYRTFQLLNQVTAIWYIYT